MNTFVVGTQRYTFELKSRKSLPPPKNQECFMVQIVRSSDDKRWQAATHFVPGLTDQEAANKIREFLIFAFEEYELEDIDFHFDIPHGVPQTNKPDQHHCGLMP